MCNEMKLKHCPFCGSHNVRIIKKYHVIILCHDCNACFRKLLDDDEKKVIELWNRRNENNV